jgi:hypothetical protein
MKCDCDSECEVLYVKSFGSKNSLSPAEGGSREQVEKTYDGCISV